MNKCLGLFLTMLIIVLVLIILYNLKCFSAHKETFKKTKKLTEEESITLKKGQQVMTNMLREFDKICRDHGLKYWCAGGTLIGTVRHKGWIHHDADIDVGMLESDYITLRHIIQKKLPNDYWFQDKSTDKHYKSRIGKIRYKHALYVDDKARKWHNGLQLDIFVFKKRNNLLIPICCKDADIKKHSLNMIFPLKELVFENIQVYVPNNYEHICIDVWGGYPPPPLPLHKQYPHEGRISFKPADIAWMKKKYRRLYSRK